MIIDDYHVRHRGQNDGTETNVSRRKNRSGSRGRTDGSWRTRRRALEIEFFLLPVVSRVCPILVRLSAPLVFFSQTGYYWYVGRLVCTWTTIFIKILSVTELLLFVLLSAPLSISPVPFRFGVFSVVLVVFDAVRTTRSYTIDTIESHHAERSNDLSAIRIDGVKRPGFGIHPLRPGRRIGSEIRIVNPFRYFVNSKLNPSVRISDSIRGSWIRIQHVNLNFGFNPFVLF